MYKDIFIEDIFFLYFPYLYQAVGLFLHSTGNISILWSKLQMFPKIFIWLWIFHLKIFAIQEKSTTICCNHYLWYSWEKISCTL